MLRQASSTQLVLAEGVQAGQVSLWFPSVFSHPWVKSPALVLLRPCLTPLGYFLRCRDCLGMEKVMELPAWGS